MHRMNPRPGQHIQTACADAAREAARQHTEVELPFNGVTLWFPPDLTEATALAFAAMAHREYERILQASHDAYHASGHAQRDAEAAAAARRQREVLLDSALRLCPASPSWRDEAAYANWFRAQEHEYGRAIFRYAALWARLMEGQMAHDAPLMPDDINEASHLADVEGITGAMHGMAKSVLRQCWTYGALLAQGEAVPTH